MSGRGSLRRRATWGLFALALAAGATSVTLRLALPGDGGRAAFYAGAWGADGITIEPLGAPAPALLPGDTVSAVGGVPVAAWVTRALEPAGTRPDPAATTRYEVVRGGVPQAIDVRWTNAASLDGIAGAWGVALFSAVLAGLAAFVLRRRPDEPAATALVLAAAAAASSSVPWYLGVTTSDVVRGLPFVVQSLATGPLYMLLWPATVHLAVTVPGADRSGRARRVVPAVYLVAMGAYGTLTVASAVTAPSALAFVGSWPAIQAAVVVPCLVVATGVPVVTWLRASDPAVRGRIGLVVAALVVSSGLALSLFWLPVLLIGRTLAPDGALGLVALPVPLAIGAAILRNRLFDIDAALNRTLVYGTLTGGVIASYVLATAGISALVGDADAAVSLLATGVAALVALPLRDALQRGVDRLLYGRRREPMAAIAEIGLRLSWAADPGGALPAIAETLRDVLRVPYAAVEVDHPDATRLAGESGTRPAEWLSVPLLHGRSQVGRIVVGHRPGERGFHPDERALLDELARQAATSIAALALREDLERSRERLVLAREEERRRLRRDLHDGLGPSLAAIAMRADTAAALLGSDPARASADLDTLGDEARAAIAEVRRLVDGLRPPALDELGLLGAIRQQARRLEHGDAAAGPRIDVEGPGDALPPLPAAVEVAAYRIAVEALTNAVRHADAATCSVRVRATGDALQVEVADDGLGMPAIVRAGVGLESMRVRAAEVGGEVVVESAPRRGTRVAARLPLRGAGSLAPGGGPA